MYIFELQIAGLGCKKISADWFLKVLKFTYFFKGFDIIGIVQTNAIISLEKYEAFNGEALK